MEAEQANDPDQFWYNQIAVQQKGTEIMEKHRDALYQSWEQMVQHAIVVMNVDLIMADNTTVPTTEIARYPYEEFCEDIQAGGQVNPQRFVPKLLELYRPRGVVSVQFKDLVPFGPIAWLMEVTAVESRK